MRFRIRLPLPWTLVATLFAVAISSAGGTKGATTTTTPTMTSTTTTTKSGPTTSTPSREENLARMDDLRNDSEHLRGQLGVKQAKLSTLNDVKDLEKKREKARAELEKANKEVEMSEWRKNQSQQAIDDPSASSSIEYKMLRDAIREWENANETLLNATTLLENAIQNYNATNFSVIDSITEKSLESERERLIELVHSQTIAVQKPVGPGDENKLEHLQRTLNNTLKKQHALSELTACWSSYRKARSEQGSKENRVNQSVNMLNREIERLKDEAGQLSQRTDELNDAKEKTQFARLALKMVEDEIKERERLLREILALTEELNKTKVELMRLEELTRTPPPPQTGKKTFGGSSIPRKQLDRRAYDAYIEKYTNRPRDPDRPWRFLCKANGCDNNASDMLFIFIGLGSVLSSLLLALRVYYCWDEGTHCFERCQRDEEVEIGKSKEAKEEKTERKLEEANCSAKLRKRSTRVASAKSTKPPAKC